MTRISLDEAMIAARVQIIHIYNTQTAAAHQRLLDHGCDPDEVEAIIAANRQAFELWLPQQMQKLRRGFIESFTH